MRQVVDSNFLQAKPLCEYFGRSAQNFAVLADYVAMEAYKGNSLASVFKSMSVVSRYPDQVVVLRGTQDVCGLVETKVRMQKRMIDRDQTRGFPEYCKHLRAAERGDKTFQACIVELGRDASEHLEQKLLEAARCLPASMQEVATNFTDAEISLIRRRDFYAPHLLRKIVEQAMLTAAVMFRDHPRVKQRVSAAALPYRFIFRFGLCCVLWVVDWIATGSQQNVRPEKVRNDLVDLHIITYATYFDGLLTADEKALRLYSEVRLFLRHGFNV